MKPQWAMNARGLSDPWLGGSPIATAPRMSNPQVVVMYIAWQVQFWEDYSNGHGDGVVLSLHGTSRTLAGADNGDGSGVGMHR